MKHIFTLIAVVCAATNAVAQAPGKMSYQAVIRNAGDALVASQSIGMQISILQGGITGPPVYVETQTPASNANGLVTIEIGAGTVVSGDFTTIDWGNDRYFIKTEIDPTGGTNYTISGTSQLLSVPYALYAKQAETALTDYVDDADADPSNEIQILSISNDTLFLSNSNFVVLPTQTGGFSGSYTDLTNVPADIADGDDDTQLTETDVDAFVSNNGYLTSFTEADGSVTNEIQTLSKSGNIITLSNNGGTITDEVNDADNDPLNELQTVSKTLDIVTLSNTGGFFSVNDNDSNPLNELQDISLSGNHLSLTNGSTVDLSGIGVNGDFNSLNNLPVNLDIDATDDFDGQYSSLNGVPANVSSFTNDAGYLTSFTESDPAFSVSPAFGITNTLMTNWSTAYVWGDHSAAGYLTSFTETDGSVTNEIQTLSLSGNNLTISGAGGNTIALPTSTTPWTTNGSNIYRTGSGSVGISTTTPLAKLDVEGDIRGTSFKLGNVGTIGNRFKIGTNANGTDTDIEYATGWLTFMPNPVNVAFALDNNGNAVMGLGTNKVGIGTAIPSEKLEIKNGSLKIADGTEGTGKVFTSDANGKGTWNNPVDNVIATSVIFRGALPVGASCPAGGSYTASSSVLEPGVYIYTLYSCPGQIGQSGGGLNVELVFLSGSGDGSGTWHDFNSGTCSDYYTGVVRVTSTSNVAVQYNSLSGSSFTVPGANSEQVRFFKIN